MVTDFFGLEDDGVALWPATLPPIPAGFDDHFFLWLDEMRSVMKYPGHWDRREPLTPEDLQFLERTQTAALPEDLRRYYLHSGFWLNGWGEPLQQWWPLLEKHVREALQTKKPLLPVLWGINAVVVCDHEHQYHLTLPAEPGLDNIAFEYPDLKTYLMDVILRELGALSE
jgi:hypothetical protein